MKKTLLIIFLSHILSIFSMEQEKKGYTAQELITHVEGLTTALANFAIDNAPECEHLSSKKQLSKHLLCWATQYNFENMATRMIKRLREHSENEYCFHKAMELSLLEATRNGSYNIIKKLLDAGADSNAKAKASDGNTWPILASASAGGYTDVVELLLNRGAEINAVCEEGLTALARAIQSNHIDVTKLLLDRKASPNSRGPVHYKHILGWAVGLPYEWALLPYNSMPHVCLLLNYGADPNGRDSLKQTPLMHAAMVGNYEAVNLLLQRGALPDLKGNQGRNCINGSGS